MRSRTVLLLLSGGAVLAATAAAWLLARDAAFADLVKRAGEGLSLKRSNVITEAERYRYLPFVVLRDDRIQKLLDKSDPIRVDLANRYLETVSRAAGSHDLFVMNPTGTTLASSNWRDGDSRVGKNYGFRSYFKEALACGDGRLYAIGATGRIPGYYLSQRLGTAAEATGVAVVKVDLSPLEKAWTDAGELVGLVDRAGVIFLSSEAAWKYAPLFPLSAADLKALGEQYRPELLNKPPLQPDGAPQPGQDLYVRYRGRTMLVRLLDVPRHDWRVMAAYDVAPVYDAANRDAAIVFLTAALLIAGGFYLRERRDRLHADRLRTILEDMSVGIAVFDADLRLVAWNGPYLRLNSYPPALVCIGRPLADIIRHNAERGDFGPGDPELQLQDRLERARQPALRQVEVRRPDGTWVEIRHSRTPTGWAIRTYSDITERKRTEIELDAHRNDLERLVEQRTGELVQANERLSVAVVQTEAEKRRAEQASRDKTDLLHRVNHDICNPLNAILGFAGLVMANARDKLSPQQYANLEKLVASGRQLNEMVADLLEDARADRIVLSTFRLPRVIEECLVTVEARIDRTRVEIAADVPADLPDLVQDEKKLRSILGNLMGNAVKFTEKGSIAIGARRHGETLEIAVADTGIGIPEESHARIFEAFERVEPHGARPKEGVGLGLAICRRFAGLMGGVVTVQSRVGEGSVFTLSIPLVHPQAAASGRA